MARRRPLSAPGEPGRDVRPGGARYDNVRDGTRRRSRWGTLSNPAPRGSHHSLRPGAASIWCWVWSLLVLLPQADLEEWANCGAGFPGFRAASVAGTDAGSVSVSVAVGLLRRGTRSVGGCDDLGIGPRRPLHLPADPADDLDLIRGDPGAAEEPTELPENPLRIFWVGETDLRRERHRGGS